MSFSPRSPLRIAEAPRPRRRKSGRSTRVRDRGSRRAQVRVVGVRAHPPVGGGEERREQPEGNRTFPVHTHPAPARVGDRDAIRLDLRPAGDAGESHRGGCCGQHRALGEGGDCGTSGERDRVLHGHTLALYDPILRSDLGERRSLSHATRPGCAQDLPDAHRPRNLLLVRPTGKSERPEGLAPSSGEPPQPKPLGRENKAFWPRMGSHSSKAVRECCRRR